MNHWTIMGLLALGSVLQPADEKEKSAGKSKPAAGVTATATDTEFAGDIAITTLPGIYKQLGAARDHLTTQAWPDAIRLLQQLVDSRTDSLVPAQRRDLNRPEIVPWLSARAEADRLLGTMPPAGLEVYERQFGASAAKLLAEAKETGNPRGLETIVRRYFHTKAGAEAADLLGTYHLDRGRPLLAALCYARLFEHRRADQLPSLTLFKAALAFRQADPSYADLATASWNRLAKRIALKGLEVGKEPVSLEKLRQELDKAALPKATEPQGWPMFRGDARRLGKATQATAPLLVSTWQFSTFADCPGEKYLKFARETKDTIEEALRIQQKRPEPMLPAFLPITAGGKVIYRSYWGIHAIDIKTGELVWDSAATASLNALLGDPFTKNEPTWWLQAYKTGINQNVIFENSVVGTLSTDNIRVYIVDDIGLPPHPAVMDRRSIFGGDSPNLGPFVDLAKRSILGAIELDYGKVLWEHGYSQHWIREPELTACHFLGPPLPLAGKLYVLTEKNAELRLVCLEPTDGALVWKQTLAKIRTKLLDDPGRRIQAVHVAYADGILVCPTNAGAVFGIDLLSRNLVWAFPYREKSKENLTEQERRLRRQRLWAAEGANAPKLGGEWKLSAPIIADGKVVFTAPDEGSVFCLSLQDGRPLWQAERKDGLYLAGVFDGKVILIGKTLCRALSLADGKKQLWQVETGQPSGMGIATGRFYYLPLRKGEVCQIDLGLGQIVARIPAGKNAKGEIEFPGNLILYQGHVVSQTETNVTCYSQKAR